MNVIFNQIFLLGSERHTAIDTILSSVCLSVTLCIVVLKVAVGSWKLYRRVHRTILPIYYFRHFSCRIKGYFL